MRAAVVGAGVIGCAIGLELRRRGVDEVTVIDRHGAVGHGSTSASCAIVRRFYAQPGMIAMAHEAAGIWAEWGEWLGPIDDDLAEFRRPGMLFIPPRMDESTEAVTAEMGRLGVPHEVLTADDVAARFPFFDTASNFPPRPLDDDAFFDPTGRMIEGAVFEPDSGFIVSPGLATQNLRAAGEREGVRFALRSEVVGIATETSHAGGAARFRLDLKDGGPIDADVVINAAGPRSGCILTLAGIDLERETRPLRREVHTRANPIVDDETGATPVPVLGDIDGGVYCRPEANGRDLIAGTTDPTCDEFDWVDDPDDYQENLTAKYRERQCYRLMKRFPALRLGPARGLTALYDVTVQDWYPIVDRTALPGYYVAIGTSGSSFKTAPVIGRLMAEIVVACEGGRDVDREPIQLELTRAGTTIDTRFLSRLRDEIATSGTVIG